MGILPAHPLALYFAILSKIFTVYMYYFYCGITSTEKLKIGVILELRLYIK